MRLKALLIPIILLVSFSLYAQTDQSQLPYSVSGTVIDAETGRLLNPVELYSRGFIYMRENEPLIQEASALVYETAKRFEGVGRDEYANVKNTVKSKLKSFLYDKTGRTPMILPIVIEI